MSKRLTKVLSLILTLVMFLSVSTPAFAWGGGDLGGGWDREIGDGEVRPFDGIEPDADADEPVDLFQGLSEEGDIQVTVEAPLGALPSRAEVKVVHVEVEDVREAVEGVVEGEANILLAMDISFWLGDDEIEPSEPVNVRVTAEELLDQKNLTVVHIPDADEEEAEPETVDLVDAKDMSIPVAENEVAFKADSFSVYAVIGGSANDIKLTVKFYQSTESEAPISTQVLVKEQFDEEGEKPLIDPGVPSMGENQSFEGWKIDDEHKNLDINGLNTYIHEQYGSITADAELVVYAMIFNVRYVIYHDQAGAVLKTQSYHVEQGGTASVMISHPYVAFQGSQNFQGWTLEEDVEVAGDYPLYKDTATASGHYYKNDTAYNLSETLDLYPYVQTGEWLIFDNNLDQDSDNTSASYTSPVFIPAGDNTAAPATPTRTGYTFGGWYKDEAMTSQFVFGSPISQETTVYAKWVPKETKYQVIFWQQNSTDAVDAEDSAKTYSFYKSEERTATTGASVSLNLADSGTAADNRRGGNDASSIGEMGFYFSYNGTNSTTTSKVVKGDGSTVLNVYYDRKVITYNFYGDLTSYSYSSYNANYPYYGRSNSQYIRVYRSGSYWYTDAAHTNRYNSTVYHLQYDNSTGSSAELQFGSIQGLYGSTMDYFDWSSASSTISGNKWPYSGKYLMWHDETTGRYLNKQYQYTTGEATTATTVNYLLAEYEVSSTTRPYTCLGQDTEGNYSVTLDDESLKSTETVYLTGDEYFGYVGTRYNRTTNNFNNATVWTEGETINCSYSQIGSNGHAYFYYARNKWNFVYESNNSSVKTESVYWQGSLSDLAGFKPTNGPDGCYFDGWYADPGFDTPFDFSQEMPNHAVQVYAKWTLTRYRVVLDPTGGEAGVDASIVTFPGNQATTFRLDYGEKVEGSSINNAEREGYTLLGWYLDKEYTQPYNFANPVTDDVADMTYINASDAERQGSDPWNLDDDGNPRTYNDADGKHDDVRGKVTIYAHWRKDPNGIIGINIRYDAVESTEHEGYFGNDPTSTIWNDPDIYADQAQAYAQPASTPKEYDPELKFLYWDILDSEGNSSGRKAYPGMTFQVEFDDAKEEALTDTEDAIEPEIFTFDRGNLKLVRPGQADLMAEEITTTIASWNFDDGEQGWTFYNTDNGDSRDVWSRYNGNAHSGSYCLRASSYHDTSAQQNQAYSSTIQIPANGVTSVSLYARSYSSGNSRDSFRVAYHPDGDQYIYFLSETVTPGTTYTQYSYEIDSVTTDDGTVNFKGTSGQIVLYHNATYKYYLYVDDVTVTNVTTTVYHTVTFVDGYTNNTIETVQVEDGLAATAPQAPDHTDVGYIFSGWDTDFSYVTSDLTVTATYTDQSSLTYTVTFRYMLPDGTWTSVSQTVQHGQAATPPFTKDTITDEQKVPGYEFNSWDRRYDTITSNITINAVYKQTATTKYVVTLRAVYGRADAGSVTHINWYSNVYDGYGNLMPIEEDDVVYKATTVLFPASAPLAEKTDSKATAEYEENNDTIVYGDHGYNLVYDQVEIPESVRIPEKPYDIPGYTFMGWARLADPNNLPEGAKASDYVTDPADFNLNDDELYIKWVEDNANPGEGHYEAYSEDNGWVPVTYVAANEQKPYHDMYAVWQGSFTIYHSGLPGGGPDGEPVNVPITRKLGDGFDLAGTVTELNTELANRAEGADQFLYGGYYLVKEGGSFAPPAAVDGVIPAYNGANWTWTDAETANGTKLNPRAGETYYIKEVPASKYLQPYFHFAYKKNTDASLQVLTSAWLISDIDDCMYQETGFVIVSDDNEANVVTQLTVENAVGGTKVTLKPTGIFRAKGVESGYLTYLTVMDQYECTNGFGTSATVRQYWVTPDGLIVTGIAQRTYSSLDIKGNVKSGTNETIVRSTIAEFTATEEPAPAEP